MDTYTSGISSFIVCWSDFLCPENFPKWKDYPLKALHFSFDLVRLEFDFIWRAAIVQDFDLWLPRALMDSLFCVQSTLVSQKSGRGCSRSNFRVVESSETLSAAAAL